MQIFNENSNYCLVLDANAWISERMLQSSAGSAVLYAVAANSASIGLPEIVEMEVNRVLKNQANKATSELRKNIELLRQLSGHQHLYHPVPTEVAIVEGMGRRWNELGGVLVRAQFTFEQAQSALRRIIDHTPPSGENNEQFRDCCIWASVLDFALSRVVHFVTNDSAFYESRDRKNLAIQLQTELVRLGRDVRIYPTIHAFLAASAQSEIVVIEKDVILDAIREAVTPLAHEIAAERVASRSTKKFELGHARNLAIKGYGTPKPSVVAVTFSVLFDLIMFKLEESEERQVDSTLQLDGSCSYNPNLHQTSDLTVSTWTHRLKGGSYGESHSTVDPQLQNQLRQTRFI